jgi:pyridoxal phosphate enzyme (YggS family)
MSIARKIADIHQRMHDSCAAAGREPSSVRLLAATKTVEVERIEQAMAAGQVLLGESRAQELRDKTRLLQTHVAHPEWHFIGHLQRNKIKYLVEQVRLIHTIDRIEIAQAISDRVVRENPSRPMGVLVEVNLGNELSKSGVLPDRALELCQQIQAIQGLTLRGLMAIPPWSPDPRDSRPYFEHLAFLAQRGQEQGLPLAELSMGMSHDFETAISCGATIIRIGTSIFGPRSPQKGA